MLWASQQVESSISIIGPNEFNAINDIVETDEEIQVSFNVTGNDIGDSISLNSIWAMNSSPFVFYSEAGDVNYKPSTNFFGMDTLAYIISNPSGKVDTAYVFIQVNQVNDYPVSSPDFITIAEDEVVEIEPLLNDIDVDQAGLRIFETSVPFNGSISINYNVLTYTPNSNYYGADTIVYKAIELTAGQDIIYDTVFITIRSLNDPPIVVADTLIGAEDDTLKINPLINDFDIENGIDSVSLSINVFPQNGVAWYDITSSMLFYIPEPDYYGKDSLYYSVSDTLGAKSDSVKVYINITNTNDVPHAIRDTIIMKNSDTLSINPLINDKDIDLTGIKIISVLYPDLGNVAWTNDTIIYSPNRLVSGIDTLVYYIVDGENDTDSSYLYINILQTNKPPIVKNDSINIFNLDTIWIDILANDSDDYSLLTLTDVNWISQPNNGQFATIENRDQIAFIPDTLFFDKDSAQYELYDELDSLGKGWVFFTDSAMLMDNDKDGITNQTEGIIDTDSDGLANYFDRDSDNDKIPDSIEGNTDFDNDGVTNYLDLDSDNDEIPDVIEGIKDADLDGLPNFIDWDSDDDLISDLIEGTNDTDLDSIPNYLDPFIATDDTDGDGSSDGSEDVNNDGNPYNDDCDADGIVNYVDYEDGCHEFVVASKGFSPNNDGINDFFSINGIEAFDNNNLQVFNKWGLLVFEKENYNGFALWGGESNKGSGKGKLLPAGIYYYILNLRNGRYLIKGYVHLVR